MRLAFTNSTTAHITFQGRVTTCGLRVQHSDAPTIKPPMCKACLSNVSLHDQIKLARELGWEKLS